MEIFIGYTDDSSIHDLGVTLEAWEAIGTPVAIQCPVKKYEIFRRMSAESLAKSDYILCDIGCTPTSKEDVEKAVEQLEGRVGMVGIDGARICKKGVIEKWPMKVSMDYSREHVFAYEMNEHEVIEPKKPIFVRLGVQ